jgi:hypothetical protein
MKFNKKLNEEETDMLECLIEHLLYGINRHRPINVIERVTNMPIEEVYTITKKILEEQQFFEKDKIRKNYHR